MKQIWSELEVIWPLKTARKTEVSKLGRIPVHKVLVHASYNLYIPLDKDVLISLYQGTESKLSNDPVAANLDTTWSMKLSLEVWWYRLSKLAGTYNFEHMFPHHMGVILCISWLQNLAWILSNVVPMFGSIHTGEFWEDCFNRLYEKLGSLGCISTHFLPM